MEWSIISNWRTTFGWACCSVWQEHIFSKFFCLVLSASVLEQLYSFHACSWTSVVPQWCQPVFLHQESAVSFHFCWELLFSFSCSCNERIYLCSKCTYIAQKKMCWYDLHVRVIRLHQNRPTHACKLTRFWITYQYSLQACAVKLTQNLLDLLADTGRFWCKLPAFLLSIKRGTLRNTETMQHNKPLARMIS